MKHGGEDSITSSHNCLTVTLRGNSVSSSIAMKHPSKEPVHNRTRVREANSSGNGHNKLLQKFEEVVSQPRLLYQTLEDVHRTMNKRYRAPMTEDVKLDLHTIFEKLISRGGIEQVADIRELRHLYDKYYEFLLDIDELQYCNDQAIKSFRSDRQPRVVESGLTPQETPASLPTAATKTKGTTKTTPKLISSKTKSLFKRPEPVKKVKPRVITEEIPEFLLSDKRNSSTSPLQVKVKPRTTLQDIPEFLYSDKRHSNRGRKQDIEKLKEKEEGESRDEVDINSYEWLGPGRQFSYGNCESKGIHVEAHDWGRDLSLAIGGSSSKVLPESEQIEDKDLNPSK